MKLSVQHDAHDIAVAGQVAALCAELGLEHELDARDDWLIHALRPMAGDSTHMLLVVTPMSVGCWWVPFQLGRATERGMEIVLYVTADVGELPGFIEQADAVRGLPQLRDRLTASLPRS